MGVMFFQNGVPLGNDAGWGGFTGNNNYVVRYDFITGSEGASQLAIVLNNIFYGHGAGTQSFGFKLSTDPTAYCSVRAVQPDSNTASMVYSPNTGYACTLWAQGLNLLPGTRYYIFVYLAGEGAEYYTGWNCITPQIVTGGSYTPPVSQISTMSSVVSTNSNFSLIMKRSASNYHKAVFSYAGTVLAVSPAFTSSLSYPCPRHWLSCDIQSKALNVSVSVQSYLDADCTQTVGEPVLGSFILNTDRDMRPVFTSQALKVSAVNSKGGMSRFVAGISRAQVHFDASAIDLSACAGAGIASYGVKCQGKNFQSAQSSILTDTVNADCVLTCTVEDTRGFESSIDISITVFPYVPPSLVDMALQRCNAAGDADEEGAYWKIKCTALCADVQGNFCTVKARVKSGDTYLGGELTLTGLESGVWSDKWETPFIPGGELSGDSITVHLTVTDSFGQSRSYSLPLYKLKWAMKFNSAGTAVGFGMSPDMENAMQVPEHWKSCLGTPVLSPNAYGVLSPDLAVSSPVEGQIYLRLST